MILETERLIFRKHEPADIDAYCAMEADPDVRRYVGGSLRPRAQAEARFRRELAVEPGDWLTLLATVYKENGLYIGRCGVYPHFGPLGAPIAGEGTLALYIASDYWGRGLATEAGGALLRFGFDTLGLSRIVATVQVGNDASDHVMSKLGLRLVRTEHGAHCSWHHYEILPGQAQVSEGSNASGKSDTRSP